MTDRARDVANVISVPYRVALDPIGTARTVAEIAGGAVRSVTGAGEAVGGAAADLAANIVIALAGASLVVLGVRRTFQG